MEMRSDKGSRSDKKREQKGKGGSARLVVAVENHDKSRGSAKGGSSGKTPSLNKEVSVNGAARMVIRFTCHVVGT